MPCKKRPGSIEMTYEIAEACRDMFEHQGVLRKDIEEWWNVDPAALGKVLRYESFINDERSTWGCVGCYKDDIATMDRMVIEKGMCQDVDLWESLLYNSKKLGDVYES